VEKQPDVESEKPDKKPPSQGRGARKQSERRSATKEAPSVQGEETAAATKGTRKSSKKKDEVDKFSTMGQLEEETSMMAPEAGSSAQKNAKKQGGAKKGPQRSSRAANSTLAPSEAVS